MDNKLEALKRRNLQKMNEEVLKASDQMRPEWDTQGGRKLERSETPMFFADKASEALDSTGQRFKELGEKASLGAVGLLGGNPQEYKQKADVLEQKLGDPSEQFNPEAVGMGVVGAIKKVPNNVISLVDKLKKAVSEEGAVSKATGELADVIDFKKAVKGLREPKPQVEDIFSRRQPEASQALKEVEAPIQEEKMGKLLYFPADRAAIAKPTVSGVEDNVLSFERPKPMRPEAPEIAPGDLEKMRSFGREEVPNNLLHFPNKVSAEQQSFNRSVNKVPFNVRDEYYKETMGKTLRDAKKNIKDEKEAFKDIMLTKDGEGGYRFANADKDALDIKSALLARYADLPPERYKKLQDIMNDTKASSPYYGGDTHGIVWAKDSQQWPSGIDAPTQGQKEFPAPIPRNIKIENLPTNKMGQKVLGEGVEQGMNDPLMWMERKYGVTKDAIMQAKDTPLLVKTRSDLVAADEYLDKLNPKLHQVEMHVSPHNEHMSQIIEMGSPSTKRRLEAVKKLIENDIPVKVKIDMLHDPNGQVIHWKDAGLRDEEHFLNELMEMGVPKEKLPMIEINDVDLDWPEVKKIEREAGFFNAGNE